MLASQLVPHQERNALASIRWTPCQRAFLEDDRRRMIWRDGNQIGKSYALAAEILYRCRGVHPFKRTHRPPIHALVVSVSLEQILPLMEKIWQLAPKDELSEKCGFDPGRGITGKPPRLVWERGPGAGSVLTFATYRQGAQRLAGGSYHFAALDEPPPESIWGEIQPRLRHYRGDLRCTFTPTPDMPDLGWLREKVASGAIPEHNYGLSEAHCWLEGAETPWLAQAEIDEEAKQLLPIEYEMRVNGAWEAMVTGAWLTNFGDANISALEPPKGAYLAVGVDHGSAAGKQAAMLFAVTDRVGLAPRAWWLDEEISDGYTTPEQDAAAILGMLRRRGLTYDSVDLWIGDRPTGDNRYLVSKSNKDLRIELARQLRRTLVQTQPIRVPKKWAGSLTHGMRLLNGLFGTLRSDGRPAGLVHPRCERFIEFCRKFQGDRRDPLKDVGDAGRYPAEASIEHSGYSAARAIFA